MSALIHAGQKQFPDAAANKFAHGIDAAIPAVEIADYANPVCIGRPNCEVNAPGIADRAQVRAELFVNLPVLSFAE